MSTASAAPAPVDGGGKDDELLTGMALLLARLKRSESAESVAEGLAFQPGSTDVFITTYPKCGTTWCSFIAHTLRSRGDLDFDEITSVVPWTILAKDCGLDLTAAQPFQPRLYKSHEDYHTVPKGGKYIYVARHPSKVFASLYPFLLSFAQVPQSSIPLEEFFEKRVIRDPSYGGIWAHYLSFYQERHNPNVLWLFYEDLIEDLPKCVETMATFMGIALDGDDELRALTLKHAAFDFMKEHEQLFDDHIVFNACKVRMGLGQDVQTASTKVSTAGQHKVQLTADMHKQLDEKWTQIFHAASGIASYEDLRKELSPLTRR
jgi:hypothetical protein